MTNSPPANVKPPLVKAQRVLASGVDSLVLAVGIEWPDDERFEWFDELQQAARQSKEDHPAELSVGISIWRFVMKSHGREGYAWILNARDFTFRIARTRSPIQRPSAMVEIRSETLWSMGFERAIDWVIELVETMGGTVQAVNPSRVDVCADVLIDGGDWKPDLERGFVTRARHRGRFSSNAVLSGFSIGKGSIIGRLYDKPLEIVQQSGKDWMFKIWGIDAVPEGHRIVRVEFQLRREALRQLRIDTRRDLSEKLGQLWVYCTTRWLRVVDDASLHHTQQDVRPWWKAVADGFSGAQGASPLVRAQGIRADRKALAAQVVGALGTMLALSIDPARVSELAPLDAGLHLHGELDRAIRLAGIGRSAFTKRLRGKIGRHRPSG